MKPISLTALAVLAALAAACSDPAVSIRDSQPLPDSGRTQDAGPRDSGALDALTADADPLDAGSTDALTPDAQAMDADTLDTGALDTGTADAEPTDASGPSCDDGLHNQGETWIDCGGPCDPCPACPGTTNLLRNGGFEAVPGPGSGQGLMPSEWIAVTQSPDTFSNDGSYGLSPAGFGNFTGVQAYEGIRWIAGWSQAQERFGQVLTATIAEGVAYRLSALLHQAIRADLNNPGAYDIGLADSAARTTTIAVGGFTFTSSQAWVPRQLEFVGPPGAGALPLIFFEPTSGPAGSAYPGIDALELIRISDCPPTGT